MRHQEREWPMSTVEESVEVGVPVRTAYDQWTQPRTTAGAVSGRPAGVDDATVEACGRLSEALEWVERARGHLYSFHHMIGHADVLFDDAAEALACAGHTELSQLVVDQVVGRDVLPGQWTYQVVEEFDDGYYRQVAGTEQQVRGDLLDGRRHVFEAEFRQRRRRRP